MNNQPVPHFPRAAGGCLVLLLIVLTVLAGSGRAGATAAADQLIWVRQDDPLINAGNDPLRYEYTEPRFAGSFTQYSVGETGIAMETRYVDHDDEWYHVTLTSTFDRPPLVINPPLRYKIAANFAHSGAHKYGSVGAQFWYSSGGATIEPREVLAYYPWNANFDGTSHKEWMINPPAALHEGATFEITAGWWNCAPCNVTWTYRAEPANAVTQLGVEVVQPLVKYQGEEMPPGTTYFADTCPGTARNASAACLNTHELSDKARVALECIRDKERRLLIFLDFIELPEKSDFQSVKEAILQMATIELAQSCGYTTAGAGEAYRLDLVLEQGALLLQNVAGGQTTAVATPLGTSTAAGRGAFLAGYNPKTAVATFRAYSTPLTVQPQSGAALVLQPPHEVELTASGFGPGDGAAACAAAAGDQVEDGVISVVSCNGRVLEEDTAVFCCLGAAAQPAAWARAEGVWQPTMAGA